MRSLPADFEDFRPGDSFASEPRLVTEADLVHMIEASGDHHPLHTDAAYAQQAGFAQPLLHGPFGIAAFLGWFTGSGIAADTVLAMLDSNWRYLGPIMVGDTLSFEMTITRCRRSGKGDRGVVGRHVRIRNAAGTLVQVGTTAMLVRARGNEAMPAQEFFTPGWTRLVAAAESLRHATATWDGAFALACGDDEAHFRIDEGRVVEAGAPAPNGAAFTLAADELAWTELFTGPSDEFMQPAMQGRFAVRGSASEYLRLTPAVAAVVSAARALFHGAIRP